MMICSSIGRQSFFTLAHETIATIETEADEANLPGDKRKLQDWAEGSQSNAMIHMASKNESVVVNMNEFDSDESKINCGNGLMDLTNDQLKQRNSKDLVSNIINIDYIRDAKAPIFVAFVKQIFNNNAEMDGWVQRALGYTLTGSRREQVLFLGVGSGANGTSTLLEVVARIIGNSCPVATLFPWPARMMQFLCKHYGKVRKGFFNAFGIFGIAIANANQRY